MSEGLDENNEFNPRPQIENPHGLITDLNRNLTAFNQNLIHQFNLKIPKGAIRKVDYYRDEYFPYLKDSVYKSNMCYLLQVVDYQIWLYQLFKPSLSVENAYFYQLMISLGIISEVLAAAIMLDPLIKEHKDDRSMGQVSDQHTMIRQNIIENSFIQNIKSIEKLSVMSAELISQFQSIRSEIRNSVHLQNWEGRLYNKLTAELFQKRMGQFRDFLGSVKNEIKITDSVEELQDALFGKGFRFGKYYRGKVQSFNAPAGFGFIQSEEITQNIFFHISEVKNFKESKTGTIDIDHKVSFTLGRGKKGTEAKSVELLNE